MQILNFEYRGGAFRCLHPISNGAVNFEDSAKACSGLWNSKRCEIWVVIPMNCALNFTFWPSSLPQIPNRKVWMDSPVENGALRCAVNFTFCAPPFFEIWPPLKFRDDLSISNFWSKIGLVNWKSPFQTAHSAKSRVENKILVPLGRERCLLYVRVDSVVISLVVALFFYRIVVCIIRKPAIDDSQDVREMRKTCETQHVCTSYFVFFMLLHERDFSCLASRTISQ